MTDQDLGRIVDLLTRQVSHWQAPRWAAPAATGEGTRGDAVYHLVQRLADLAADVEGRVRQEVPRLPNDTTLPDQLRVVAADLVAADPAPEILVVAATDAAAVRAVL
ncbi:hypothetical protein SAMN05421684_1267 [Asanoa ishikariensis]|uniref:Mycothiol maleylpyruvate isomerase N-terminal domain-containing protein n=1 Tax=Asanoa ishikariensis TaxID=137265 RepID=A0A1H3MAH9_9ACTN|nr:hypothetical protein [Asanoa ishikariensis]SDY73298.1 hypothetical protein SAMN05421684_1267 [Asanoa ishikariensis]